ncbi:NAD-dependent epimerase/dehydratase family protein [Caenispirillum salinarum]|uniref:NAD-dependent epimerase/dehydratase family protein n=1 Tax=Caenispirillum salinarum TaxID=859058 RepID=UPI00384DE683
MVRPLNLVTGGAGFLGRHIVRQLAEAGEPVRVLDPACGRVAWPQGVEPVDGSVLDPDRLSAAMKGVQTVYHLAAVPHLWADDPRVFEQVNLDGTRTVLAACKEAQVKRVVVTSSAVVLVGHDTAWTGSPITEDTPRPPLDAMVGDYARSKCSAEREARAAAATGLPVVLTYPTVPIGAGDESETPPTRMLMDFLNGRTPAYLQCRMNIGGAADMARGHIMAARHGADGESYILGGENLWMSDLLAHLEAISGRAMPRRRVPYPLALAAANVQEWWADTVTHRPPQAPVAGVKLAGLPMWFDSGKARRDLGWQPAPLRDALADAVRWMRETGRL